MYFCLSSTSHSHVNTATKLQTHLCIHPHMRPCVFMAANLGILLSACHSVWQLISLSFFPTDHPSMQSPNCQSGCLKVHSFIHPPTLLVCLVHRPSASLSRLPSIHPFIHTNCVCLFIQSVWPSACLSCMHWNGKFIRVTFLVSTGHVECNLPRLQWIQCCHPDELFVSIWQPVMPASGTPS